MHLTSTLRFVTASLRRWLHRLTEPHLLYPVFAVLLLGVIWGTTLNLIRVERAAAEQGALALTRELAQTYEAQVVRALREIDQTLKFIKYAYEIRGRQVVLRDLKARALLPPDLLFLISISDSNGNIVASTRPFAMSNVSGQDYFQDQRRKDTFSIGLPRQNIASGQWELHFSRRLDANNGKFSGIAILSVDAAYFVSAYDQSKLGEHGVIGILGTDGVFRARRSGETVSAGDKVDIAAMVPVADAAEDESTLSTNTWDGIRRYTSVQQIYNFPLAVIVGLSADEQLAATHRDTREYLWRASAASFLLILIVALMGRMSWRLAQSRQRESEAKVAYAERVEHLAYHDALTGLPNRSLFSKLLDQGISQAHRNRRRLALLFLDLDRFKNINDTLGHDAGDQLLQEVATRLNACLRDSDTVARLGGDEFVAMLPELNEERYAATVAQKILSAVARPFTLLGQEFRVTASVGISIYPQDGVDEQTLKKNADIAMYRAKEEGKNQFQFYSEKLNASTLERLSLESNLRRALERHEFQLHYQACQDARSGRITGVEALLRWQHPDLGTVAPMQFIPVAEETGLIVAIGKWVLRTACLQNVAWQNQGLPRLTMGVNLTARQFYDENLLADLAAILGDTHMDGHLLELEITESLLMHNAEKTLRVLKGLKDMGIRIAIDDFGLGYSSLSKLKQFPLDTIKIERSIIRNVASAAEDKAVTAAMIAMGRTLSLNVVAQGVETKEQADFLRRNACDEFQGFYLNKPVPAGQITELLQIQADVADSDAHAADEV